MVNFSNQSERLSGLNYNMLAEEVSRWLHPAADLHSPEVSRLLLHSRLEVVQFLMTVLENGARVPEWSVHHLFQLLENALLPLFLQSHINQDLCSKVVAFLGASIQVQRQRDSLCLPFTAKLFGNLFNQAVENRTPGYQLFVDLLKSLPQSSVEHKMFLLTLLAGLSHPDFYDLLLRPGLESQLHLVAESLACPDLCKAGLKLLRTLSLVVECEAHSALFSFWPSLVGILRLDNKKYDKIIRQIVQNLPEIVTSDEAELLELLHSKKEKDNFIKLLISQGKLEPQRLIQIIVQRMAPESLLFDEGYANPASKQYPQFAGVAEGLELAEYLCQQLDQQLDPASLYLPDKSFLTPGLVYALYLFTGKVADSIKEVSSKDPKVHKRMLLDSVDLTPAMTAQNLPYFYSVLCLFKGFSGQVGDKIQFLHRLTQSYQSPRVVVPCLALLRAHLNQANFSFMVENCVFTIRRKGISPAMKEACLELFQDAIQIGEASNLSSRGKELRRTLAGLIEEEFGAESLKVTFSMMCRTLSHEQAELDHFLARCRGLVPCIMEELLKPPCAVDKFSSVIQLLDVAEFQPYLKDSFFPRIIEALARFFNGDDGQGQDEEGEVLLALPNQWEDALSEDDDSEYFYQEGPVFQLIQKMVGLWGWRNEYLPLIDIGIDNPRLSLQTVSCFQDITLKHKTHSRNIALQIQVAVLGAFPYSQSKRQLLQRLCALGEGEPPLFPLWEERFSSRLILTLVKQFKEQANLFRSLEPEEAESDINVAFRLAICQTLGHLLRSGHCRSLLLPFYEEAITDYAGGGPKERVFALFLICDLIEHFDYQALCTKWQFFTQYLLGFSGHMTPDTRISATWGLTLLCQKTPLDLLGPNSQRILLELGKLYREENEYPLEAKDNLTSAIGFLIYRLRLTSYVGQWAERLPLSTDQSSNRKQLAMASSLAQLIPVQTQRRIQEAMSARQK